MGYSTCHAHRFETDLIDVEAKGPFPHGVGQKLEHHMRYQVWRRDFVYIFCPELAISTSCSVWQIQVRLLEFRTLFYPAPQLTRVIQES
ncbi:hypothetical protein BH10CYA1_BH10CYA1_29310 [soil metagenome]